MKPAVLLALVLACTAPVLAAPPSGFAGRVEGLRRQVGVPGLAIAIVEDDKITFAKGFGVRRLGSPEPVDADTIFPTGSTGKAFTVAALGILVDQGKIDWNDKVIDRLLKEVPRTKADAAIWSGPTSTLVSMGRNLSS